MILREILNSALERIDKHLRNLEKQNMEVVSSERTALLRGTHMGFKFVRNHLVSEIEELIEEEKKNG